MKVLLRTNEGGNAVTYEWACDEIADRDTIPSNQITLGSTAIILEGESGVELYMAKSDKQWKLLGAISAESE